MEWNGVEWNGMEWNGIACSRNIIAWSRITVASSRNKRNFSLALSATVVKDIVNNMGFINYAAA